MTQGIMQTETGNQDRRPHGAADGPRKRRKRKGKRRRARSRGFLSTVKYLNR
jgi:hypothetical protein